MHFNVRAFLVSVLLLATAFALLVVVPPFTTRVQSGPIGNDVLTRAVNVELGLEVPAKHQQHVSSGVLHAVLDAIGELDRRADAAPPGQTDRRRVPAVGTIGCSNVFTGEVLGGRNTRVNQDCSLRRQAEEIIVVNATNPANLIAGQNDSRLGFNHCGYAWSFDGGRTWGDQTPPFFQFLLKDNHTADACSDPTAAFDADGNAYVGGIVFDVVSAANAVVVAKSNAAFGGSFYHSPKAQSLQTFRANPLGVIASDNNPVIFNDKELMTADANATSPKKNNVYMTWTRFNDASGAGVGGNSPIYFSQSTNGGATWSPGIEISGVNAAACTIFSGSANANACDQDQGSDPAVGPDGTIYVVFGNGNTPLDGINQVLMVSCPGTANCALKSSWTAPVKVGDLIGTHPVGPSAAGCAPFRRCLPPNGYRVPEFTSMSVSVDNVGRVYVAWSDFRNGGAPCTGPASTATPPCDNDVFYAFSTNRGATWSATVDVTPASQFGPTAQWQPWSGVTADGSRLWVAYYDRSYGACEFTGCNDITAAAIDNPASASPTISYSRLTTASMPNLTPANNPLQAGFLGDYMGLAVDVKGRPHVVWADTRGLDGAVEEDIYYTTVP